MKILITYADTAKNADYTVPTIFFKYTESTYWCEPISQEPDTCFGKCREDYCNPTHKLFHEMKRIVK